jgi:hypothetical protein
VLEIPRIKKAILLDIGPGSDLISGNNPEIDSVPLINRT